MKKILLLSFVTITSLFSISSYAVCFGGLFEIYGYGHTKEEAILAVNQAALEQSDQFNWVARKSDYTIETISVEQIKASAFYQLCSVW